MPNRDNDELARALAGLSSGEHVEPTDEEHAHDELGDAGHPQTPAPSPRPAPSPVPRQTARPAPGTPQARPGTPPSAAPQPVASNPASPVRPAAPTSRPSAPAARPAAPQRAAAPSAIRAASPSASESTAAVRPAAPSRPIAPPSPPSAPAAADYSQDYGNATSEMPVVDDDDAVIVPAPPVESLAHTHAYQSHSRAHLPNVRSSSFRQTIIPILLTLSAGFAAGGALKFFVGEDSPLNEIGMWLPITLFVMSAFMLIVAIINMLQVRAEQAANVPR